MFAFGEDVTRQRAATTTDEYHNTVLDWTPPTNDLILHGCGVGSGGSFEPNLDARNPAVSDFDVITDVGVDVIAKDRLVIRGKVCDVIGEPFDQRSPYTGWAPGAIIRAKIVAG